MTVGTLDSAPPKDRAIAQKFYFAAWRWHFYAGLYVVPFLIMLAVTGMMMLWFITVAPEYGDRINIPVGQQTLSITDQAKAALQTHPEGSIGKYIAPYGPANPALFQINLEGGNRMIALDPYTGNVVRDRAQDGTWREFANDIHGTLMIGAGGGIGDLLIEIAASLGIILLVTGLYLWWPRNRQSWRDVLVINLTARGRAFWKSLHVTTGFWMSIILFFFLISGLSWAGVWGGKYVQAWSTFPAAKWDNVPLSDKTHAALNHGGEKDVPWALEQTPMPMSDGSSGVAGLPEGVPVVLQNIVAYARTIGFDGRVQINAPSDETGVWTLSRDSMSYDSTDPTSDKTVHIDQYTGRVLATVDYADYSVPGKAMAVGIALHEGQMGWWNLVLNAFFCLAIITICVSGIVMWWKRRPSSSFRLGAPPLPEQMPMWKGAVVIMLALSFLFPVAGLTLLAVLALDMIVLGNIPRLKAMLN
jgi:uncharacterized iron-regulated membrane protein